MAQFLTTEERVRLIGLVASLYDFTDSGVRGRRIFLQEIAGLGLMVPHLNLEGTPTQASGDVVGKLERYGELPDRDAYHALGSLLHAILGTGELDSGDATFVADLIIRYSLVNDLDYLDEIRNKYEISTAPGQGVKIAAHIPLGEVKKSISPEPEFFPLIKDSTGLESIINSEDNFLDIHMARGAVYCSAAVGRVEIPQGEAVGTAFLIGPKLVMTNQHVVDNQDILNQVVVRFDYVNDRSGIAQRGKVIQAVPDFYCSSPAEELDYALFKLAECPLADVAFGKGGDEKSMAELSELGKHLGYLPLTPRQPLVDKRVNVLQHPDGKTLKVVMTQNYIVHVTDNRVQYVADTMEGSSGSPVFNNEWQVIALHHSGAPYPPDDVASISKKLWKGKFRVNEGIPMRAILADIKKKDLMRHMPK